jgi:hypothetical protein
MIKERVYFLIIWYDANAEERYTRTCRRHVDPQQECARILLQGTNMIESWRIKDVQVVNNIQGEDTC